MPFSMSQASLPVFEVGLAALSAALDKAQAFATAKKVDPAVLLNTRLAPDMFPLVRQVQVATDQAKNGAARLAGIEPPRYDDTETTIDQLKTRIADTIAFLKTLDKNKIDSSIDREITFPLGPTNKGHMTGADYLDHFVLPNFYFHRTAAYADSAALRRRRWQAGFSRHNPDEDDLIAALTERGHANFRRRDGRLHYLARARERSRTHERLCGAFDRARQNVWRELSGPHRQGRGAGGLL